MNCLSPRVVFNQEKEYSNVFFTVDWPWKETKHIPSSSLTLSPSIRMGERSGEENTKNLMVQDKGSLVSEEKGSQVKDHSLLSTGRSMPRQSASSGYFRKNYLPVFVAEYYVIWYGISFWFTSQLLAHPQPAQ